MVSNLLKISAVLCLLIITNTLTFYCATRPDGEPQKSSKATQMADNIKVGVLIPDRFLTGSSPEDWGLAESFLSPEIRWKYYQKGKVPGLEGTGFAFEQAPYSENIVLK